MLIQIHMLQNYAPSNLNRDDTGSPKSAYFGGVQRGRISSQCLKRSIRLSETFQDAFKEDGLLATRTKRLPGLVEEALKTLTDDEKVIAAIVQRVPEIGSESGRRKGKTDEGEPLETRQLIFIGANEIEPMAEKLLALYQEKGDKAWKKLKIADITKALGNSVPRSVDIAMFGRMTTSDAFENVQAAVQVAHALSANAVEQEFDYFTAVDDLQPKQEPGAGMIGDVEYNSSTYYKYINIHWDGLAKNLGDDVAIARQAVLALLEAAAIAQPSGKQNTFAAHNLPDLVLVEVREKNLPVSYANAFIKPARSDFKHTLMQDAITKLDEYMDRIGTAYNLDEVDERAMMTTLPDVALPKAKAQASLSSLQEWLADQLPEA
jgi:CRISPR system Cascade subunit CasC